MGVTDRIRAAWSVLTAPPSPPAPTVDVRAYYSNFVDSWLRGLDSIYGSLTGDTINQPYRQHSIVHRAIRAKVSALSRFNLEIYPDGPDQDEPIDGHWLPDLIMAPDMLRRAGQLYEAMVVSLDCTGEVFLYHADVRRGDAGPGGRSRPHELWFLNPATVTAETRGGELVAWKWRTEGETRTIPLEDVTFMRCENPYDPIRGLGSLESAFLEYTGDYRAAVWNRSFFDNAAIPPIVFKTQNPTAVWEQGERDQFLQSWEARYQGATRRGRAGALPGGIDVEVLKSTQAELDYIEGRRQYREHILTALGVPPAVAGVPSSGAGNYQNYGQQRQQFHFDTMLPLAEFIARSLTVDLLRRYDPGLVAIFKTEHVTAEITAEQFAQKVEVGSKLWSMGVPFEDVNDRLDLGFDTMGKPWLEEGWLPFSVTPAADAMEPPEPPALPPAAGDEDDLDDEDPIEPDVDEEGEGDERHLVRKLPKSERTRAALWRRYARRMGRGEARMLTAWRRFLRWVRDYALTSIEQQQASVRAPGDPLPSEQEVRATLLDMVRAPVSLVVNDGIASVAQELGVVLDPSILDPIVTQVITSRNAKIVGASQTVMTRLRNAIADGLGEGESPDQLTKRVRSVIQEQYTGQARTVARTESAAGFAQARHEAMTAHGVRRRQWLTARDAKVRKSHRIDGQIRQVGDPFVLGNGVQMQSPHAAEAPVGEVVNCRCVELPVLEDE